MSTSRLPGPADWPVGMEPGPLAILTLIRSRIVSGAYPPGQQLVEAKLAEECGVSRVPVREAFRALAAEGLISLERHRGAFVTVLTTKAGADLLEIREALEPLAARHAALRRVEPQLTLMDEVLRSGFQALVDLDRAALTRLNTTFHSLIWEAAGNEELNGMLSRLNTKIAWVYSHDVTVTRRARASWSEHALILETIANHDGELAERRMRDHIQAAATAYHTRGETETSDGPAEALTNRTTLHGKKGSP
jgi:DNA-binding GntR family transcriptional regulator